MASKAERPERSRAQPYSSTSEITVNIINLADQLKKTGRGQLNSKIVNQILQKKNHLRTGKQGSNGKTRNLTLN